MKYSSFPLLVVLTIMFITINPARSQEPGTQKETKIISFPDIPGYKTLVCDFHMHTVFSDGSVWPDIRVGEAITDGLDAISITDHLEYQPHSKDIPFPDRNRVYQLAQKAAGGKDLIIINGAEITRAMPPGHANALFLTDANQLMNQDSIEVFRAAKRQGAFVIWNHPNWYAQNLNGSSVITPMHKRLIEEGLIQGIEIVNEFSFSDEALKIALDNNLTIMSGSDIHGLIDEYNNPDGVRRPVTLVFATSKSSEALKEALIKGRTVVWYDQTLIGKEEFLIPLIQKSLKIGDAMSLFSYTGEKTTVVEFVIENHSSTDYILENQYDFMLYNHTDVITVKAHASKLFQVKLLKELNTFEMHFKVLNALTAPGIHPVITLKASVID